MPRESLNQAVEAQPRPAPLQRPPSPGPHRAPSAGRGAEGKRIDSELPSERSSTPARTVPYAAASASSQRRPASYAAASSAPKSQVGRAPGASPSLWALTDTRYTANIAVYASAREADSQREDQLTHFENNSRDAADYLEVSHDSWKKTRTRSSGGSEDENPSAKTRTAEHADATFGLEGRGTGTCHAQS